MTKTRTITRAAVYAAVGACAAATAGGPAYAAVFQPGTPTDTQWITMDVATGAVYNADPSASHGVTAGGVISAGRGGGWSATVWGRTDGGPVKCELDVVNTTTGMTATASGIFSASSVTLNMNVPDTAFPYRLNDIFAYGVSCSLPPTSAGAITGEVFQAAVSPADARTTSASGWVPMAPADSAFISHLGWALVNSDRTTAHWVSSTLPAQQLFASNYTALFHGMSNGVSTLCNVTAREVSTGATYSKSVTDSSPNGASYMLAATLSVGTTGVYDVVLMCKLPAARFYGGRFF